MTRELDPEVIADIRLREQTVRERGGSSREPSYSPPTYVDEWLCKACKRAKVPVTADAVQAFTTFNTQLETRGDCNGLREKLRPHEIVYCDACREEFKRTAPDRRRGQVERMRPVIQQIRNSKKPAEEHAAIAQLRSWHHPDVEGLVQAVSDRLNSSGKNKPKAGL